MQIELQYNKYSNFFLIGFNQKSITFRQKNKTNHLKLVEKLELL